MNNEPEYTNPQGGQGEDCGHGGGGKSLDRAAWVQTARSYLLDDYTDDYELTSGSESESDFESALEADSVEEHYDGYFTDGYFDGSTDDELVESLLTSEELELLDDPLVQEYLAMPESGEVIINNGERSSMLPPGWGQKDPDIHRRIQGSAWIDLDMRAAAYNVGAVRAALLKAHPNNPAALLAVVKADAYGHGILSMARAFARTGVDALGVAQMAEAVTLALEWDSCSVEERCPRPPIVSWIYSENFDLREAINLGIQISVSTLAQLQQVITAVDKIYGWNAAVRRSPVDAPALIHLKIDTGMSRAGASPAQWQRLCAAALSAQFEGLVRIVGIWSHLSCADEGCIEAETSSANHLLLFNEALDAFRRLEIPHREELSAELGLAADELPPVQVHLAASAGIFRHPEMHFDMVRAGLVLYGLSPNPYLEALADLDILPVMSLRSRITQIKLVEVGTPVSYGGTWQAPTRRWLGLVPIGYADGIPRAASGDPELTRTWLAGDRSQPLPAAAAAFVRIGEKDYPLVGQVCMDQFVVDLGEADANVCSTTDVSYADETEARVQVGDLVEVFGGQSDGPTADTWAQACGTINYEIITRLARNLPRFARD